VLIYEILKYISWTATDSVAMRRKTGCSGETGVAAYTTYTLVFSLNIYYHFQWLQMNADS